MSPLDSTIRYQMLHPNQSQLNIAVIDEDADATGMPFQASDVVERGARGIARVAPHDGVAGTLRHWAGQVGRPPARYVDPICRGAAASVATSLVTPVLYATGEVMSALTGGKSCSVPIMQSWAGVSVVTGVMAASIAVLSRAAKGYLTEDDKRTQRIAMVSAIAATGIPGAMAAWNVFSPAIGVGDACALGFGAGVLEGFGTAGGVMVGAMVLCLEP